MSDHYYDSKENLHKPFKIEAQALHRTITLWSDKGVFSKDRLDNATKLLIETTPITGNKVCDLGCGIGIVSVFLNLKKQGVEFTAIDANKRAVLLAQKNFEKHNVNGDTIQSDAYSEVDQTFTHILTNPPMAAGRKKCYEFIEEAPLYLEDKGCFSLVARHKKGGKMLYKKMKETFSDVTVLDKQGGFRVYHATK